MGNEQGNVGSQQAAQPVNPSQTGEQISDKQQFVSVDQFQAALSEMERKVQGIVDKNISRVDKRVAEASQKAQDAVDMLKSTGMQITPEQENALREKAVMRALQEQDKDQVSKTGVNQNRAQGFDLPTQKEQVNPITATAMQMMTAAGVQIDEGDPEFKVINLKTENPYEFLSSVQKAIAEKQERTSKQKTNNPAAMPGVTGAGGTGSPLEAQYLAEKAKLRQGDIEALWQLKQKFRKAGLSLK